MKNITLGNLDQLPYAMEEAINRLRVNVGFLGSDIKKIMVVSTFPNEGKSLITTQLWRQMAEAGIPSVLVDVDMRNSVLRQQHPMTGENMTSEEIRKIPGTSDYLAGNCELDDVICHTQYEKGDVILNAENIVNPSLLLEGHRFTEMLDQLAERYRYVFLDTPPLDLVSDGERIGSKCDGTLLVVRSGVTPTAAVKSSIAQLQRADCPILGVVLNRADAAKRGYYHKRYGSYYGKNKKYTGYGAYGYGYGDGTEKK